MPQVGRVGDAGFVFRVVVDLVPAQVPTPRKLVRTDETLVADVVDGSLSCTDSHDGMSSSLSGGPCDFEEMDAALVSDL